MLTWCKGQHLYSILCFWPSQYWTPQTAALHSLLPNHKPDFVPQCSTAVLAPLSFLPQWQIRNQRLCGNGDYRKFEPWITSLYHEENRSLPDQTGPDWNNFNTGWRCSTPEPSVNFEELAFYSSNQRPSGPVGYSSYLTQIVERFGWKVSTMKLSEPRIEHP